VQSFGLSHEEPPPLHIAASHPLLLGGVGAGGDGDDGVVTCFASSLLSTGFDAASFADSLGVFDSEDFFFARYFKS